jgi:protein-tyrosine-phosphatase
MIEDSIIVFVCEHGAAKSIIAATYFNELAKQRGLRLRAVARGTNPESRLSDSTVEGLSKDGLISVESEPQQLSWNDMESSWRIISFCELPPQYQYPGKGVSRSAPIIQQWDGIPPVSEDYDKARDAIVERLKDLIDKLRSSE